MPPATALATPLPRLGDDRKGLLLGLIAVALFSLTLPMTRLAVAELPAVFVALGRALVAACLAALWLWHCRAALPRRAQWLPLALVAAGCVVGFPWLTSVAMMRPSICRDFRNEHGPGGGMRGVIRLNDPTSHGGKVTGAAPDSTVLGVAVARKGYSSLS